MLVFTAAPAIDFESFDRVQLTYHRAFHDRITVTIIRHTPDNVHVVSEITPQTEEGFGDHLSQVRSTNIEEKDVVPIITFADDDEVLEAFQRKTKSVQLDGSAVRLEISQNGYSELLTGTSVFSNDADAHEKELAKIALYIFELADIRTAGELLY